MAEIFVGSVSVGVVPDAKTFSDDLRKQILPDAGNIGREFGQQMGRAIKDAVKIQVEELKAELRKGLDTKVNVDTAEAKADIAKTKAEVESQSWRVRLHVDRESINGLVNDIRGGLKRGLGNLALGSLVGTGLAAGGSGLLAAAGPLAALTAGVGAFAALAVPELTKVTGALGKFGAARRTAMGRLTPQERELVPVIRDLKNAFHDVEKTLAPVVDDVIKLGASTLKDLLPTLTMFVHVGVSVLTSFLRPFDAWVKSKSFAILAGQFAMFGDTAGRILGPQLVILMKAFSQLFVQLLPTGLKMLTLLLPAITQFIVALTPGIVILATLATNVLKWVMANHLLIPALIAVLAIIVVVTGASGLGGIIAATLLVALVVGEFATHWRQWWADIKHWAQDAWNFLTHGWGQFLIPGLTLVRVIVELVAQHWRQAWDLIKNWTRDVWNFIINGLGRLLIPQVRQVWIIAQLLAHNWQATWNQIKQVASSVWNFLVNNVFHPLANLLTNTIPGAFRTAVNNISGIWAKLKSIFSGPVSFLVNTVYDNGIARLWNDVMSKVGGPTLPTLRFASGGRVPGWGGGDIWPALLEPGETVVSKEHSRALAPMFKAAGVPGYQGGGIIGDVVHGIGSIFHIGGDVFKILNALITGNATAAENAFANLFHTPAHGDLATMMLDIPRKIVDTAVHWALSHLTGILGAGGGSGPIPGGGAGHGSLYSMAASLFHFFGWGLNQLPPLIALWNQESGWRWNATNPTSGAYGIPQALPAGKMAAAGADWRTNPFTQIRWGESYIHGRYGTPAAAEAHELAVHWYDQGGWWPSGTFGINTSGHSEYVLTHDDMSNMGGTTYIAHFDGVTYQSHEAMTRRAFQQMEIGRGRLARMGRRQ